MKRLPLFLLSLLFSSFALALPAIPRATEAASASLASADTQEIKKPKWLLAAEEYVSPSPLPEEITVNTIFGELTITEPVLIELLQHPVVQRMKEIDQHGPPTYFLNEPTFSRYDHCLGVFALLRMYKRPLEEQVAGLLHDASHTCFSHLADHLFKTGNQHSYQDIIHAWYLRKMEVDKVLERYGLSIEEIDPDQPQYAALEQKHPRLCANRIQYILNGGLVLKHLTTDDLATILDALHFEENKWYFTSQAAARKLADVSVYCTQHVWSTPAGLAWRHWLCSALRQAIAIDLLTSDDIHFGVDRDLLKRLNSSDDKHIKEMMEKCYNAEKHFSPALDATAYDLIDIPKIRAVDPMVQLDGEARPISLMERDEEYRAHVEELRGRLSGGIRIKFVAPKA